MITEILIARKSKNNVNFEFKIERKIVLTTIKNSMYYSLTLEQIINNIEHRKVKYYTYNPLENKSLELVNVKGGEEVNKYLSSMANDGIVDNIDNLPLY